MFFEVRWFFPGIILFCLCITVAAQEPPDKKVFFLPYELEDSVFAKLKQTGKYQGFAVYKNDSLKLSYGAYRFKEMKFFARDSIVYIISFLIEGQENSEGFLSMLSAYYGSGNQSNPYVQIYTWEGRNVILRYEYDLLNARSEIRLTSKSIYRFDPSLQQGP